MGDQTRFWTKWRTRFRICRICVWLFILALLGVAVYLNQNGLPDYAKRRLIDALRQHGIAVEFTKLRWDLYYGLVAENVRIGGESPDSPSLTLQELQLQINYQALLHRKWQLDGVVLRHGKFILPVSTSNDAPVALIFDHIQTELRFQTNDVWMLDNFQANFAGGKFTLSGQVANASAVSNWGMFHGKRGVRGASQSQLKKIGTTLSRIHLNKNSQVSLNIHGDARHLNSFFVFLTANAPGAQTPWGSAENMTLVAHSTATVQASGTVAAPPLQIDWKAQLGRLKTGMAKADYVYCSGSWHANGEIDWKTEVAQLQSEKLNADFISCAGFWRAPDLDVTNLYARLGGGYLHAAVGLNTATRELIFTNTSCFNPQAVAGVLTEKARQWLDQFELPKAPELEAGGSVTLPPWTNNLSASWSAGVQHSVRIDGELAVTNPTVRGFSLNIVQAHFACSNEIWEVPDALLTRTASRLQIQGRENGVTRDYQWHVKGALSADVLGPFLNQKAEREFRQFSFPRPVILDVRIQGRLYDYDSIIADGHAALAGFVLRGEPVDSTESDFHYAHQVIEFRHPHLAAGVQTMHADEVRLDWPGDRIYFINGRGTANPQAFANAIGPQPAQVMRPYHFLAPANVIVNGYAPLRDSTNADLNFETAEPVQIKILNVRSDALRGELHWIGQTLILTNLDAALYGGTGTGNVRFDFRPQGAEFTFDSGIQEVDLHSLAMDLSTPSNHIQNVEGKLSGQFIVTSGYSEDWKSCNGYGDAKLHDGLLWDVPVFGVLSPFFNRVSPGLGNLRATDASAQFFMTNGVIATDNLKIHTKPMLLHCNGTLDLKGRLDAHFTAELLHDVRGFGPLFSIVMWPVGKLFECKVTGMWDNPKVRPLYLSAPQKVVLDVLHPIHFLESLQNNKNKNNTEQQQKPPSQ